MSSRRLCPAAASPPGAAYLSRGRQGPVHVEEAERWVRRRHIAGFHPHSTRLVGNQELDPELPGAAPVPQGMLGEGGATATYLGLAAGSLSEPQIPGCNAPARRPTTAGQALLKVPGAEGILVWRQAAGPW